MQRESLILEAGEERFSILVHLIKERIKKKYKSKLTYKSTMKNRGFFPALKQKDGIVETKWAVKCSVYVMRPIIPLILRIKMALIIGDMFKGVQSL